MVKRCAFQSRLVTSEPPVECNEAELARKGAFTFPVEVLKVTFTPDAGLPSALLTCTVGGKATASLTGAD